MKTIPKWGHLSVLKTFLYIWPFLCKQWTWAVQEIDSTPSSWCPPSLSSFFFLSFLFLSYSFSLPLLPPLCPLPISVSLFSSSPRQRGKCQFFRVICELGGWWDWWIAAPGAVLHCQPNNLWFITPEMSWEWRKTQNRKSGIEVEKRTENWQKKQHSAGRRNEAEKSCRDQHNAWYFNWVKS